MPDVFNNPSNDYVDPGLAPCAGTGSDTYFEFINNGAGVVSGADILSFIDLSGIKVSVTGWTNEKKTLQSGEVIYVPGLAKGLLNRTQVFNIPEEGYDEPTIDEGEPKYFMILYISIAYYNNFRYYNVNLEASSNYILNIDIDDAMNIALGNANINATVTYDPSSFTFTGGTAGYEFNISNTVLTISDVSTGNPFPEFMWGLELDPLEEDASLALPSSKYPNGAMLGYVLGAVYPATECTYDSWIYMNHVDSPFDVYIPEIVINEINNIETYQTISFDPSIVWPEIVSDVSVLVADVSVIDVSIADAVIQAWGDIDSSIDSSIGSNFIIDPSTEVTYSIILDSSASYSNFYDSSISGSYLESIFAITSNIYDSSILNSGIMSSNITESYINPSQLDSCDVSLSIIKESLIVNSNLYSVTISDSSIKNSFIGDSSGLISSSATNTYVENVIIEDASLTSFYAKDSSIQNSNITVGEFYNVFFDNGSLSQLLITGDASTTIISNSIISDSSIQNSIILDSSISNIEIKDSSISGGTISDSTITDSYMSNIDGSTLTVDNIEFTNATIYDSYVEYSVLNTIYIEDSSILTSYINIDSSIVNSDIENSWTNAINYFGTWTNDVSCTREYITGGKIHDSSINNTTLTDVSIYTSKIYDSSIVNCTLYNVELDASSGIENSRTIWINSDCSSSISWTEDTSSFYQKYTKVVNVGMNGCGDTLTLSGADYLDYINTHNGWFKVGPFASRISTQDTPESSIKNLIGGFYLFNPQTFPVQVEYMVIN